MNKYIYLVMLCTCVLLHGCESKSEPKLLEDFLEDAGIEEVDKIILLDGSTGKTKGMEEQGEIEEFLSLIEDVVFTPQANQEERDGILYGIRLFDGEKELNFSLNHIDGVYYDTEPAIYPLVDGYYKHLGD